MSVRAYVEVLGNIGPHRLQDLVKSGWVSDFYVRLGPGYEANEEAWPECARFVRAAGGRIWGWPWCDSDQRETSRQIVELDARLGPDGWCVNIEKPLEERPLGVLVSNVVALGRPVVASLAGSLPAVVYDYRTLANYGVDVEWQAYLDSGEGPPPDVCVRELYQCSRLLPGRRYRATVDGKLGWGELVNEDTFASYRTKGRYKIELRQTSLWPPLEVVDRGLFNASSWSKRGVLLGYVAYPRIRVALDTTRTAQSKRNLAGWAELAASARIAGSSKRGVSVYLAEVTPDAVFAAIAEGAA